MPLLLCYLDFVFLKLNYCFCAILLCLMIVKVNLSETAAEREARLSGIEAELSRAQAACSRLSQV